MFQLCTAATARARKLCCCAWRGVQMFTKMIVRIFFTTVMIFMGCLLLLNFKDKSEAEGEKVFVMSTGNFCSIDFHARKAEREGASSSWEILFTTHFRTLWSGVKDNILKALGVVKIIYNIHTVIKTFSHPSA